jgi:hypothetical protein
MLASLVAPDALMSVPTTILAAATAVKSGGGASGLTSTADLLSGSLFGASLFPWFAMLYWLGHPRVRAPPGVTFGLTCLLAFVFGTIPAAIGAGLLYGKPLADVDWLHGAAESLLTITNCVVVLGFRDALAGSDQRTSRLRIAAGILLGLSAVSAVAALFAGGAQVWALPFSQPARPRFAHSSLRVGRNVAIRHPFIARPRRTEPSTRTCLRHPPTQPAMAKRNSMPSVKSIQYDWVLGCHPPTHPPIVTCTRGV